MNPSVLETDGEAGVTRGNTVQNAIGKVNVTHHPPERKPR